MTPSTTELFGPTPYLTNPGGNGPNGSFQYNPIYFATPATAYIVANIIHLGTGLKVTVVAENAILIGGPFQQNAMNQMIEMPDGSHHYAGLIADIFNHGYAIDTINSMISEELAVPFTYAGTQSITINTQAAPVTLMTAAIGKKVIQTDGTVWQRIS